MNRKYIKHIVIVLIFISYLLCADKIFASIRFKEESKQQNIQIPQLDKMITYNVDKVEEYKIEWKEFIQIEGIAFTRNDNLGTLDDKIFLVLKSDNKTYIFDTAKVRRNDITEFYKRKDLQKNLDFAGFKGLISKDVLENDRYRIGIIVENKTGSKFTFTDSYFTKYPNAIIKRYVAKRVDKQISESANDLAASIEQIEHISEGAKKFVSISGWAHITGEGSDNQKVYIFLKDSNKESYYWFDTIKASRPDVTQFFYKNMRLNLDDSGFASLVNIQDLPRGSYQAGLLVEKGASKHFMYSDHYVDIGE